MRSEKHTDARAGALQSPLPALNDIEGTRVPDGLPPVVDAHVHLFPEELFASVWKWFDRHGWPVRYRLPLPTLATFLQDRGVARIVALSYAHKPGVAENLNRFMARLAGRYPRISALATVFPGEPQAERLLQEAFQLGLHGVKLHAHVQCFDPLGKDMETVYDLCSRHAKALIMHVGREPKSPAYACDPYELCSAAKIETILASYPRLRLCVPHLGADEFAAYARLIETYDNLWLDTTMMLADYFPGLAIPPLKRMRTERIMFGSDFPNIPYAWDRELKRLARAGLPEEALADVLGRNAVTFYDLPELTSPCNSVDGTAATREDDE